MPTNKNNGKSQRKKTQSLKATASRSSNSAVRGAVSRSLSPRRRPTGGLPLVRYRFRQGWRQLLEMRMLWVALFVLAGTWSILPRALFLVPQVESGAIANRTYIADRDLAIANEAATLEFQESAREEILPVYSLDLDVEKIRRQQLAELFREGRAAQQGANAELGGTGLSPEPPIAAPTPTANEMLRRLVEASAINLNLAQLELFAQRGFSVDLEDRLSGLFGRLLRRGVVANKQALLEHRARGVIVREMPSGEQSTQLDLYRYLGYPDQARQAVEEALRSWTDLKPAERRELTLMVVETLTPNLTLDSGETLRLRTQAAQDAGTVSRQMRQGEVIVRRGDEIDDVAARAIREMSGTRDLTRLLLSGAGVLLFLIAMVLLMWAVVGHQQRSDRSRNRLFSECLLLLLVQFLAARFAFFVAVALANAIERAPFSTTASYTYAIPFGALALVAVLLYGRDIALVLSLVFSLVVGQIAGGDVAWLITVYSLAGSLAAIYALDQVHFRQRSVISLAGLVVALVNVAAILTLKMLVGDTGGGAAQIGFDLVCAFSGGLIAAALTSFAVPILENLLSITTRIKLIELANPNLPLQRRLALEAPGTFQHSLAVANLATAGCDAIDADSLMVNTCALYHDIGKILRPQYFVENQVPGRNPHDKIQPTMSALILINHVKEGSELARQENLPGPILDGIEQHHGSRLIKFFYNRAKERCDPETDEVREADFRYPGPKPQSKEMGVMMLADAVEAASRTLVGPSRQKIRGLLDQIFDDCLQDNQLDDTNLTLGDLRRVRDAFQRVLMNIYHRRVDYPGFDFNREPGQKPRQQGGEDRSTQTAVGRRAS